MPHVSFQVSAISNVEAKKRFEFLEAVSVTMAAHLRFFRQVYNIIITHKISSLPYWIMLLLIFFLMQGYELLNQMEPYINQVCQCHSYFSLAVNKVQFPRSSHKEL